MSLEVRSVEVQLGGGEIVAAKFIIWPEAPEDPHSVKLTLQFSGKEVSSTAQDFYEAMSSIRRILEDEGSLLRCYGASRNVHPSGMSRSMGRGTKAYRLKIGSHAEHRDLVSIFDTGPDITPATITEQEDFFRQWVKSRR